MSKNGRRAPTHEELQLWQKVTDMVAPLDERRTKPAVTATDAAGKNKDKQKALRQTPPEPRPPATPPTPKPQPPPALASIDRRTRGRIARGTVAIDARIDLHGMTQEGAERRLKRFLTEAQGDGAKLVLVITGKGKPGRGFSGEERGVLRRVVPMWLASADLRPLVVGFDEAGPGHGGGGALYVRMRRARR